MAFEIIELMNVAFRAIVSPRSFFSIEITATEADDCSSIASAGYSQEASPVNASDRPQADEGEDSCRAAASGAAPPAPGHHYPRIQKASFRAELLLPYGHIFA